MAVVFYGPLSVAALRPFDLPQGHPAFLIAYGVGTAASLGMIHWVVGRMMNDCCFALTAEAIELGKTPGTVVKLGDVLEAIPVAYRYRPFRQPLASVSPGVFTILLLRLHDGSRLVLMPACHLRDIKGAEGFMAKLVSALKPVWRESAVLSPEDVAAMRPGRVNRLQRA